jgi:hypothetical protein
MGYRPFGSVSYRPAKTSQPTVWRCTSCAGPLAFDDPQVFIVFSWRAQADRLCGACWRILVTSAKKGILGVAS